MEVNRMISKAEILERLAKGEDAQKIADELAGILNDALAAHINEQTENQEKIARARNIVTDILDFIERYYSDLYNPELREITDEEILDIIEKTVQESRQFLKAMNSLENMVATLKDKDKSNDPLLAFISEYVDN